MKPRKQCTSFTFCGSGKLRTAAVLEEDGKNLLFSTIWPRNLLLQFKNGHLLKFFSGS